MLIELEKRCKSIYNPNKSSKITVSILFSYLPDIKADIKKIIQNRSIRNAFLLLKMLKYLVNEEIGHK